MAGAVLYSIIVEHYLYTDVINHTSSFLLQTFLISLQMACILVSYIYICQEVGTEYNGRGGRGWTINTNKGETKGGRGIGTMWWEAQSTL